MKYWQPTIIILATHIQYWRPTIKLLATHNPVNAGLLVDDYESASSVAAALRRAATDLVFRETCSRHARQSAEQFSKERVDLLEAQMYRMVLRRVVCAVWGDTQ